MFAWHVAITKPFSELIAERHLEQQDFQPFNPKCLIMRIVRNRRIFTEKPYIPGYIFIRFDVDTDNWQRVNNTKGVQQLIYSSPERPAWIRDEVMQVLIDRCSGGQYVAPEHIDQAISKLIPIGALVRVVDGPFEGMRAPVHWSHHQRVSVLLSFLGVPRKIDLPARSVEVVGRA